MARLIDDVNALISAVRQRDLPSVDASVECAQQHMVIVDALLDGDADRAVALMVEHVRHVATEVLAHFDEI